MVRRLTAAVERDDRPLRPKLERPAWATEMVPPAYREEPPVELPEEPAPPPYTEIPLDQLDLVPSVPNATNQNDQSVDADA